MAARTDRDHCRGFARGQFPKRSGRLPSHEGSLGLGVPDRVHGALKDPQGCASTSAESRIEVDRGQGRFPTVRFDVREHEPDIERGGESRGNAHGVRGVIRTVDAAHDAS